MDHIYEMKLKSIKQFQIGLFPSPLGLLIVHFNPITNGGSDQKLYLDILRKTQKVTVQGVQFDIERDPLQ